MASPEKKYMFKKISKKPGQISLQDKLTKEQIDEFLVGYKQIDNVKSLALGTHVRYFTNVEGEENKFRFGGYLYRAEPDEEFVVLVGGMKSWCVTIKNAIFFYKVPQEELLADLHDYYKKIIAQKDKKIKNYKKIILNLRKDAQGPH